MDLKTRIKVKFWAFQSFIRIVFSNRRKEIFAMKRKLKRIINGDKLEIIAKIQEMGFELDNDNKIYVEDMVLRSMYVYASRRDERIEINLGFYTEIPNTNLELISLEVTEWYEHELVNCIVDCYVREKKVKEKKKEKAHLKAKKFKEVKQN